MTSAPDLTAENLPTTAPTPNREPNATAFVLATLAILMPGMMAATTYLPLPMRGGSALIGGVAVLLCGPYLFSHALARWVRRSAVAG